jgi:integrase
MKSQLLEQLRNDAKHKADQEREESLYKAKLAAISSQSTSAHQQQQDNSLRPIPLSELVNQYVLHKSTRGWEEKGTRDQGEARLQLIVEIIGDKLTTELTKTDALKIEETLPHVPTNRNKVKELRDLGNIHEQIKIANSLNLQKISSSLQSTCWKLFKDFVTVGKSKNYIPKQAVEDIVNDCIGIKTSKKESKKSEWAHFTLEDLQLIFNGSVYQSQKLAPAEKNHDYYFWLPLLAIFTGGRINELSQLLVGDVGESSGVKRIAITNQNEEGEEIKNKSVKTEAGMRLIPIHSTLINFGFIDFVEKRKLTGEELLFKEGLTHSPKSHWGGAPSKWFNGDKQKPGYKDRCGVNGEKKVFHSFRKIFAYALEKNGVSMKRIKQLIGHENSEDRVTMIYTGLTDLPELKIDIEKLKYDGLDLSHVSYEKFKARVFRSEPPLRND